MDQSEPLAEVKCLHCGEEAAAFNLPVKKGNQDYLIPACQTCLRNAKARRNLRHYFLDLGYKVPHLRKNSHKNLLRPITARQEDPVADDDTDDSEPQPAPAIPASANGNQATAAPPAQPAPPARQLPPPAPAGSMKTKSFVVTGSVQDQLRAAAAPVPSEAEDASPPVSSTTAQPAPAQTGHVGLPTTDSTPAQAAAAAPAAQAPQAARKAKNGTAAKEAPAVPARKAEKAQQTAIAKKPKRSKSTIVVFLLCLIALGGVFYGASGSTAPSAPTASARAIPAAEAKKRAETDARCAEVIIGTDQAALEKRLQRKVMCAMRPWAQQMEDQSAQRMDRLEDALASRPNTSRWLWLLVIGLSLVELARIGLWVRRQWRAGAPPAPAAPPPAASAP